MSTGKKLSEEEKIKISTLKAETTKSNREIARIINRSEKVMRNYLIDPVNYGNRKVSGAPCKISTSAKRLIVRVAANKMTSPMKIKEELKLDLGKRRIQQILSSSKYLK